MLDNNLYNLNAQLIEESRSLWRIRDTYVKDAKECNECSAFWKKMQRDKEEHISDLKRLIAEHLKEQ